MAKKRKTLEQKKRTDLRHLPTAIEQTISTSSTYSLKDIASPLSPAQNHTAKPESMIGRVNNTTTAIAYRYAVPDLRRTFFTTLAIVLAQIVLIFIIHT